MKGLKQPRVRNVLTGMGSAWSSLGKEIVEAKENTVLRLSMIINDIIISYWHGHSYWGNAHYPQLQIGKQTQTNPHTKNTHTQTHTNTYMQIHTNSYTSTHIRARTYILTPTQIHTHTLTETHTEIVMKYIVRLL